MSLRRILSLRHAHFTCFTSTEVQIPSVYLLYLVPSLLALLVPIGMLLEVKYVVYSPSDTHPSILASKFAHNSASRTRAGGACVEFEAEAFALV